MYHNQPAASFVRSSFAILLLPFAPEEERSFAVGCTKERTLGLLKRGQSRASRTRDESESGEFLTLKLCSSDALTALGRTAVLH